MLIYKYRNLALAKKMLSGPTIKVTPAAEFNDPFELSPTIDPKTFTPKNIRTMLLRDHIIDDFYLREGGLKARKQFLKEYRHPSNLAARVQKYVGKAAANAEFLRKSFASRFDHHHRLFCGSKRKDSILMWSHYADDHKGCVIAFDSDLPPFRELKDWLIEVEYRNDKAEFAYDADRRDWHRDIRRVVGSKFKDWAYEDEIRFIFPSGIPDILKIPATTIKVVIFGARCPEAGQEEIAAILREKRYAHVEMARAKLSRDCFALEIDPIA